MRKSSTNKSEWLQRQPSLVFRVLTILLAGAWIYAPVLHGDWLWDDDLYLTANPLLTDPNRLWKIWFTPGSFIEYYPIEETLQWFQWQLWHLDTLGYHISNVVLHLISALLIWKLLNKFDLKLAWLGGLIFAIHPVMVESVAWITEFKNTLSLPPFLLAVCFYLDFEERGRQRDYLLALGWFLVAMLCKPTMVMFPFIILLYAWWKRSRINWNDFIASVPFLIVSLGVGLMTVWSGIRFSRVHQEPSDVVALGGFFSRMALTGLSLAFYFSKAVLPMGLSPIYPYWNIDPPSFPQFLPWPILVGVLYLLWVKRESWGRHALLGFGFFFIMLLPFVTINVGGYTNFTWVMDHFLYIPIIGLIGLTMAGLERLNGALSSALRRVGIGFLVVLITLLVWGSHVYAGMFINEETLSTYTLAHNPDAWLAHYNLGVTREQQGRITEAMAEYDQALRIRPAYSQAHNNKGVLLYKSGRPSEAIQEYQLALGSNPNYAQARNNLGNALADAGRIPEALNEFQQAILIKPDFAEAYCDLGNALGKAQRWSEAVDQFQRALQIDPNCAEAQNDWGNILLQLKQTGAALDHFQATLQIDPHNTDALYNRGIVLAQMGRYAEAIDSYEAALRIKPASVETHNNLGISFALSGRTAEARNEFMEALRLNPNYTIARDNLARVESATLPPAHK